MKLLITAITVIASILGILTYCDSMQATAEEWVLDRDGKQVLLGPGKVVDQTVIADIVRISGQVEMIDGAAIIANEIQMDVGARVRSKDLLVIASHLSSGALDASGDDGGSNDSPGANGGSGGDGGRLWVAARHIDGTLLIANGGNGGRGAQGKRGRNGRDGRCDGFGRWRKAERGQIGGTGGHGGKGGDGGEVILILRAAVPLPEIYTAGGEGGESGAGGPPGRGGRGCVGLGGSQATAGDGEPGDPGKAGAAGVDSTSRVRRHASLEDLIALVDRWRRENGSAQSLRDRFLNMVDGDD